MAEAILAILPALVSLIGTIVSFYTSKDQTTARIEAQREKEVNSFNEALAKNNNAVVTGMLLDQHDRVRALLAKVQGGRR